MKETLQDMKHKIGADTISKKGFLYTVRRQFYYRMGKDAESLAIKVSKAYPNSMIDSFGEHFVSFKGGSSVANSSHWWCKFTLVSEEEINKKIRDACLKDSSHTKNLLQN